MKAASSCVDTQEQQHAQQQAQMQVAAHACQASIVANRRPMTTAPSLPPSTHLLSARLKHILDQGLLDAQDLWELGLDLYQQHRAQAHATRSAANPIAPSGTAVQPAISPKSHPGIEYLPTGCPQAVCPAFCSTTHLAVRPSLCQVARSARSLRLNCNPWQHCRPTALFSQAAHRSTHPLGLQQVVGAGGDDDLGLLLQGEVRPRELRVDVVLVQLQHLQPKEAKNTNKRRLVFYVQCVNF